MARSRGSISNGVNLSSQQTADLDGADTEPDSLSASKALRALVRALARAAALQQHDGDQGDAAGAPEP